MKLVGILRMDKGRVYGKNFLRTIVGKYLLSNFNIVKPKFMKVENTRMTKDVEYGYIYMITTRCIYFKQSN